MLRLDSISLYLIWLWSHLYSMTMTRRELNSQLLSMRTGP